LKQKETILKLGNALKSKSKIGLGASTSTLSLTSLFGVSAHKFSCEIFTVIKGRIINPSYKLLSNFIMKYR
jgi:hypothetical protein